MKKAIKWILIVVPVLIILAVIILLWQLDSIARKTIETQGTASTNLQTTLDSCSISLLGGNVKLNNLKIGSPKGFSAPTLFDMKGLGVTVSVGELRQNPIKIAEITVDGPHLVVEQVGGKLNVQAAMDQMPKSESSSTMKMIIGKLQVTNTQVTLKPGLPFLQPEYSLTIPSVTLTNIGNADGNQNGAAIKDVLNQLLPAMLAKLKDAQGIPAEVKPFLSSNTDDLKAAAADQLQKQGQKYLDQAKNQANNEIQKGLGNLLAPKKDKK